MGGTHAQTVAQLVLFVRNEPHRGSQWFRQWPEPTYGEIRKALAGSGYDDADLTGCVICGEARARDWWDLHGLRGPCCGGGPPCRTDRQSRLWREMEAAGHKAKPLRVVPLSDSCGDPCEWLSHGWHDPEVFAAAVKREAADVDCKPDPEAVEHAWRRIIPCGPDSSFGDYDYIYQPSEQGKRGAFPVTVISDEDAYSYK